MAHFYRPDGSLVVRATPFHFVLTGVKTAAVGAALSLIARSLDFVFVSWSVATVFAFWTVRALVQGVFVPSLLDLRFGRGFIEGPKVCWLFRDRVVDEQVDWTTSGFTLGRLIVQHPGGNQIFVRLSWYSPEDRVVIEEQVEHRRQQALLAGSAS
ncbi:MAG TPA: hypothetical protein VF701_18100 [Thermoanaerobaculia bacterium]